jgi:hypothetical protein
MTKGQDGHEPGDEQRRVTRRAALATGAGAYAGSMLLAAASLAAAPTPKQLLEQLRREIVQSRVNRPLKTNLTKIIDQALSDLARGQKSPARKALKDELIPALQRNSGHHGLSARRAKAWIADAENVVSKLSGLGAAATGNVYVFDLFNEPITGFAVAGKSAGTINAWSPPYASERTPYTPAQLRVPRAKSTSPGQSAIGDNAVSIPWESFTGRATIKIPDPASSAVSLNDDLILFVATNQAILLTTRGQVHATFNVTLQ